jgi:hypothetical protein
MMLMEEISFAKVFTVPYRWLAAYLLLLVDKNQMIPAYSLLCQHKSGLQHSQKWFKTFSRTFFKLYRITDSAIGHGHDNRYNPDRYSPVGENGFWKDEDKHVLGLNILSSDARCRLVNSPARFCMM